MGHIVIGPPPAVAAVPTVGAYTTASGVSSSLSVTYPTASTGDMLICVVGKYVGSTMAVPSGWTSIVVTTSGSYRVGAFYKTYSGSGSVTFTAMGTTYYNTAMCVAVSNVSHIDAGAVNSAAASGTNGVLPAVTTANPGLLFRGGWTLGTSNVDSWTFPSPLVKIGSFVTAAGYSNYSAMGLAYSVEASAGVKSAVNATVNSGSHYTDLSFGIY